LQALGPMSTDVLASRKNVRLDIQGLRGLGIFFVVTFHAKHGLPGSFVMVDMFFTISGFVIAGMLVREWQKTSQINFKAFYFRRFQRLVPALALCVGATALVSIFLVSPFGPQENAGKTGLGALFFSANLVIAKTTGGYFGSSAELNPLLNTWSLSVEEQFYFVFPLLVFAGWRLGRNSRNTLGQVLVLFLGSISLGVALLPSLGLQLGEHPVFFGFYSPVTRAWEFAAGALLFFFTDGRKPSKSPFLPGLLGALLLGSSLFVINETMRWPGPWTLLPIAGTVLILYAGCTPSNHISLGLSSKPLAWLGDRSYSLYLWHWPFIVFASYLFPSNGFALLAGAGMSVIPALAAYEYVEVPIRFRRDLNRGEKARLVIAVMTPAVFLCSFLVLGTMSGFWNQSVRAYQSQVRPFHLGKVLGCDTTFAAVRPSPQCQFNSDATGKQVFLFGDSNADHFSEGVVDAAKRNGNSILLYSSYACSFLVDPVVKTDASVSRNAECSASTKRAMKFLGDQSPGLVILAMGDSYWWDPVFGVMSAEGVVVTDRKSKGRFLESSLEKTVSQIQELGHKVVLVQPTPVWVDDHTWDPSTCTTISVVFRQCQRIAPLESILSVQGPSRDTMKRVSESTGAKLLDAWPELCGKSTCDTGNSSFVKYRDARHISVGQSASLSAKFYPLLRESA
jgi:peptidoglycan/LPS O-acetylase OafA/YrhL